VGFGVWGLGVRAEGAPPRPRLARIPTPRSHPHLGLMLTVQGSVFTVQGLGGGV
jgi:hypothetical protein